MSERKQDLHKQVIGNMLSCSKPRVALRMILRVYRSVFASTLVLTAISTVIAIALCAVTQPGNWDHLHRGHLLIAQTSVASVTTGMRFAFSYTSYWDGKSSLEKMTAHWACFFAEALAKGANSWKDLLLAAEFNSDAWDRHMTFAHRLMHMVSKLHAVALQQLRGEPELTSLTLCPIAHSSKGQKQTASDVWEAPFTGSISSLLPCLRGQNQHKNRTVELAVLGTESDLEESDLNKCLEDEPQDEHESVPRESDVTQWFDLVTQTLVERCVEGEWVRTDAEAMAKAPMWEAFILGKSHFEDCRTLANRVNVTCCQMPWVRVGLALLLLCGMVLPALMDAFSKFSWTVLVVQLLFVQSYWSVHEMSRAMEKQFLWDLDDTHAAEYQEQFNRQIALAQPALLKRSLDGPTSKTLSASLSASSGSVSPKQQQNDVSAELPNDVV